MDSFFPPRKSRHVIDLNIVPILDMFVSVIFFLLLSTTFIALTKNTLPPSSTVTVTSSEETKKPLSPKLILFKSGSGLTLNLSWRGQDPGKDLKKFSKKELESGPDILINGTKDLLEKFKKKYPDEKTVRIGLGRTVEYQKLISIMDGSRDIIPDAVLISYEEAEVAEE